MSECFGRLILVYGIHEVIIQHTKKVLQNFNSKNRQLCNIITHGLKLKNKQMNNNNKSMVKKRIKQSDSLEENRAFMTFLGYQIQV